MAGVKISALPPLPSAALTDLIAEVQPAVGGTTYKATLQQVLTLFTASSGNVNAGLINQLAYYAASGNVISGLATAANGVLVTSAGSVPSISSTLPTAVQGNITQLGAQSQALNMNTHLINNVVDPVALQDAATKNYVDTVAQGLNVLPAVYAASTVALTATYANGVAGVGATLTNAGAMAAFSLDGVSPPLNSRVLIKNQASALENGIYTVTVVGSGAVNWVLTRATDYDQPAEINPGDLVLVNFGTANSATGWVETATVTTIGVDSISFTKFGSSGTVTSISAADATVTLTPDPIISTGTIAVNTATFVRTVKTQVFTSNGTYTPSTGMLYCTIELVGGGGGGGHGPYSAANNQAAGAGGAGGGYARLTATAATIGASQAVTVGAGGAGGTSGGTGATGGTTSVGALVSATGGTGGADGAVSAPPNITSPGGIGGTGSGGDVNIPGGYGESASVIGNAAFYSGGGGGNSMLGAFTANLAYNGGSGGLNYGAGGMGKRPGDGVAANGGAGAPGIVIITEFCNQ